MSLAHPTDEKTLNESEVLNYVCQAIQDLEQSKKLSTKNSNDDAIIRLCDYYNSYRQHREKICEQFINQDFIKSVYYFLIVFSESRSLEDELLNKLYTFILNLCDYSEKFASAIYTSPILNLLIDNCLDRKYIHCIENCHVNELLRKWLTTIHNVFRYSGNIFTYRVLEFKNILVEFIKQNYGDRFRLISVLTLSYIVEEDEINMLNEGVNAIETLFSMIKKCLETCKNQAGFTMKELMNGVRCISFNDKMKERICEIGGLSVLTEIIKPKTDPKTRNFITDDAIEATLGTIWNLCFNPIIKSKLIEEYQIEDLLKPFQGHGHSKIHKNYEGIMWEIKEKETELKKSKLEQKPNFDVFISYSWANKQKILEIKSWLEKNHIKVWIDEEQMVDSILEAMASGIENSRLIMIGISSSYAKSENCRSEAEYAYRIKKPIIPLIMELKYKPHSWLGLLIGSKVYFEFSERYKSDEVILKLIKSIKYLLCSNELPSVTEHMGDSVGRQNTTERLELGQPRRKWEEIVKTWSCADVLKWLENSEMDHLRKKFVNVSGVLLIVMCNIRSKSPEYFNDTLKNEFKLKFVEVMKFHHALDELTAIQ